MRLQPLSFGLLAFAPTALASLNTTQEFYLKTSLTPGQDSSKDRFNNLYLEVYHSGAGMSDAVLVPSDAAAVKGSQNNTINHGQYKTFDVVLDLGNEFPWALGVNENDEYAKWQPMTINADGIASYVPTYLISASGLIINDWDDFQGWLACDWSRGVPQLFALDGDNGNVTIPCSCAQVELVPQYI